MRKSNQKAATMAQSEFFTSTESAPSPRLAQHAEKQRSLNASSEEQLKILLVDDNWDHAYMAAQMLGAKTNYHIRIVSSGSEALYKLASEKFSLLLLDYNLSGMSGLDLIKKLEEENYDIPVVMVTGLGFEGVAVEAMKRGAYDYVIKTGDYISALPLVVEKALVRHEFKRLKESWDTLIVKRDTELQALNSVSEEISKSLSLKEVLKCALVRTIKVLDASCGRILFLENNQEVSLYSTFAPVKDPVTLPISPEILKQLIETRKVIIYENTMQLEASEWREPSTQIKSASFIPLRFKEKVIGALALGSHKTARFSNDDAMLLGAIGSEIGAALENAKLYAEIQRHSEKRKADVAEQKRLQDQLIRSEKLAAIGQFVAGIAHELNNPLASVSGFAQILLREEGLNKDTRLILQRIYDEVRRATQIIHNLLSFARERKAKKTHVDLNDLLSKTLSLRIHKLLLDNIELSQALKPHLPWIYANPLQLQLVFLNIIINAEHAMVQAHRGGKLRIATSLKNASVKSKSRERKFVEVLISDDGPGISRRNIRKIFDPFFTTKRQGEGTGLGLSIAYGIIQEHGGEISVQSERGNGTCFTIQFPVERIRLPLKK